MLCQWLVWLACNTQTIVTTSILVSTIKNLMTPCNRCSPLVGIGPLSYLRSKVKGLRLVPCVLPLLNLVFGHIVSSKIGGVSQSSSPSVTKVLILSAIGFLSFFCMKLGVIEWRKVTKPGFGFRGKIFWVKNSPSVPKIDQKWSFRPLSQMKIIGFC